MQYFAIGKAPATYGGAVKSTRGDTQSSLALSYSWPFVVALDVP